MSISQYQYFFIRLQVLLTYKLRIHIVKLASESINTWESPIINCSPSLRTPYCVSRKRLLLLLGGQASSYVCPPLPAPRRHHTQSHEKSTELAMGSAAFSPQLSTVFRLALARGRGRAAPCKICLCLCPRLPSAIGLGNLMTHLIPL